MEDVPILVSPGYGAGWSTWAETDEHKRFLCTDPGLVDLAKRKANETEVEEYITSILGSDVYVYMGGWTQVIIEYIPKGTQFSINSYDGFEYLITPSSIDWMIS